MNQICIDREEAINLSSFPSNINELICIICHRILIAPKKCSKCLKLFCTDCIRKWADYFCCCYNGCNAGLITAIDGSYLSSLKFKGRIYDRTYQERVLRDWRQERRIMVKADTSDGIGVYSGEQFDFGVGCGKKQLDFQRDGSGVYEIKASDKRGLIYRYEGQWKSNMKNGKGKEQFYNQVRGNKEKNGIDDSDKEIYASYEGDFVNNMRDGFGTCTYFNGDTYTGQWSNNHKSGKGKDCFFNGDAFTGSYVKGKREGFGVFKYKNGDAYTGQWEKGALIKGNCKVIFNSLKAGMFSRQEQSDSPCKGAIGKMFFEGVWDFNDHNVPAFFSNDRHHEKHFKNSMKTGKGRALTYEASIYEGEWLEGKKHGFGSEYFLGGDEYEGEWLNEKKYGYGVMRYANGSLYKGNWKDNSREGDGMMIYFTKDVYEGQWKGGKQEGKGVMYYFNGFVYEGKWKDDKKHGRGILTDSKGQASVGQWYQDIALKDDDANLSMCIIV